MKSSINSAIIGDSPIMLILANHLKKREKITIYTDKNKVGGAWSYINYQNSYISRQTNVVVPANKNVEKFQSKINESLKQYKIKIEKAQGFHKPLAHLAKENFRYEFNGLFNTRKNFKVIRKKINNISVNDQFVNLDKKKFDKIYIPYFIGINKIKLNNVTYNIPLKIIKSKHILLIFKDLPLKEFIYTEDFDDMFDRAQITRFKNFVSFTARVRLENKRKQLKCLLNNSKIKEHIKDNNLLYSDILKYQNYFRNEEDIKILENICNHKNINVVNTFQFFEAFLDLNNKYLKHF